MKNLKQVRGDDLFLDARHDKVNLKKKKLFHRKRNFSLQVKKKQTKIHISSFHDTTRKQKHNITKKKKTSRQILTN